MPPENDSLDYGATVRGLAAGQKVFRRFTLKRLLGRGGMGAVWLAHDDELEREVALKFLPEIVAHDRTAIDDLKRETRRALELTHEHIVRIHDFISDGTLASISMEYVEGDTLANRRLDRPGKVFEPDELRPLVGQLCAALDYAHTKARVVHRDLKPANLMVNSKGDLKITDFGISATVADSATRVSKVAGTSGTPVYMSPQQMMGDQPAATDDIYSLGATLYELLTGKPPFHAGNIVLQVQNKVPPAVAERRRELEVRGAAIPPEWEQTIAACLAKDPAQRPQSAGEVAVRLGLTAKSAESVKDRAEDRGQRAAVGSSMRVESSESKIADSRSKIPLMVGLAAALVVLAGLGWYFGIHAPEQRRIEAERMRLGAQNRAEAQRREAEKARLAEQARMEAERAVEARRQTEQRRLAEERRQAEIAAARMPRQGQPFENTLGMKFVPVPGVDVLFGAWEVRVQDFEAFVRTTNYDATGGMRSIDVSGKLGQHGATWRNPGFNQGPTHPVVGVNDTDAKAFCAWLTEKERREGRLGPDQSYRLPTNAEWSVAVGPGEYPWGDQWPPPHRAGNYADATTKQKYPSWKVIAGYDDGYADTSPVGSFAANRYGLYDMGGNVWQFMEDGGLRGASFLDGVVPVVLASSFRLGGGDRIIRAGFRCVVAIGSVR